NMNIRQQNIRGCNVGAPQQNFLRALFCLFQPVLSKQRLPQEQMPLPGVRIHLDTSAQHAFRLAILLPVAQQRSHGKLCVSVAASAQIDRPLQSLLCLIPMAQLHVSQTNLVISLIVIWESMRSLLEMIQTSRRVLLLQTIQSLLELVPRLSRHLQVMYGNFVSPCLG